MHTVDVPWASALDPKTGMPKKKIKTLATGLWSRYGNPIMAPDWFLNALPCCPLDGELWAGRGKFQLCRSICAGDVADPRFDQISYAVYSSPPLTGVFATGEIKNSNMLCDINQDDIEEFIKGRLTDDFKFVQPGATFEQELLFLSDSIRSQDDICFLHRQVRLPTDNIIAQGALDGFLAGVLDKGGEGVVVRDGAARWTPKRHKGLLKYKPYLDSEAKVVGFVSGKVGKQGNVLGKIGAIVVNWQGVEFEIGSGLTFEEREFATPGTTDWAIKRPETRMPDWAEGKHFKPGDTISFKYRETSDDGVPKEGRFWRKREGVE
jgi:DNA ligase-1